MSHCAPQGGTVGHGMGYNGTVNKTNCKSALMRQHIIFILILIIKFCLNIEYRRYENSFQVTQDLKIIIIINTFQRKSFKNHVC